MGWVPPDVPDGPMEYDSYFDGPEAKLYRREYEAEVKVLKVIDKLLDSLTPADNCPLFTFAEIREWNLKHTRKRSITQEDGA